MPNIIKVKYNNSELVQVTQGQKVSIDCKDKLMESALRIENIPVAILTVTAPTGSTVYIQKGTTRIDATEQSGKWNFTIGELGTWTAYASKGSESTSKQINIAEARAYTLELSYLAIVSWATGSDAEILAMVEADHAGKIDLRDYWAAGQVRSVSLGAIAASGTGWSVGESHSAQTIELVLMDTTCKGFTLVDANRAPHFIVGQKNSLNTAGYMNSSNTNAGGWRDCARRGWCNSGYLNALPSTLKGIFKQFKWKQGKGSSATSGLQETTDNIGLTPEGAVFGSSTYSQSDEAALYSQWTWYKTASNRIKNRSGSAYRWWECSPYSGDSAGFCRVSLDGTASDSGASGSGGLAPFGCI